ncbi:MAG: hypothetical protein H6611_07015 [Ignavibacteriales bacterium]|nr:hypothetical protein [Ignavibacteriales bacterium]
MNKLKVIYLLFITLNQISAQINIHKNITTENGLINAQVSAILQDSKGYIWFGTYDGVSKWDGNHFENYQTHNGMLSSAILDIKEGPDGKIYFANYQGGIIVYDNGILDTINAKNGLVTNVVMCIAVLQNNDILFGSYGNKITKLHNGILSNWSEEVGFPDDKYYSVRDVYQDPNGTIYFATQNGLVIYENNAFKILTIRDGLNSDFVFGVVGNGKGTIYLSTYKGINKIVNGKVTDLTKNTPFNNAFSNKIILTKDGTMYCATSEGIVSEKNGKLKFFTEENGLAYNNCFSVFEDNNEMIYFGTNGKGFNIYNPKEKIISYNLTTGLPNESIWSILKSTDGTLYLGSVEGLIINKNNRYQLLNKNNGLGGNFIRVLKESNDGSILIGTKTGFSILKKSKIENFSLENDKGINQVYSILESESGEIYLGTQTGITVIKDGKEIRNKSELITNGINKGLESAFVYSISQTNSGMLIFSSLNGVATYYKNNFNFFTTQKGLVDNAANTTHVSSDGSIWIGTLKGINIIRDGKVTDTIDVNDGLSNNSIADIEEDKEGKVFVATYHGLNILTKKNDSYKINQLYKRDGLIGDDFTHEGTFLDNDGNLWLGTLTGVSKYNPSADNPIKSPPKLYLTGLQLFNNEISLSRFKENPQLSYDENFLNFIYTGINLSAPEKVKYQYMLSGIDKNWVETNNNFAPYTNLDDGNYIFQVKASNEWGYWSEPTKLSFTINPAWWETWWFYTITILSIAGFIAFVASYRYRHLLAIEKVRTKISTDLHDSIGSGLTEITFLSEMVKSQVKDNVHANKGLNNISGISKTLIDEMRDIVWLVNPNKDTLKDLFYRLQDSYQEALNFSNMNLIVNGIDKLSNIRLPMSYRQNIYLMFKEAINNSIKYSKCNTVEINVKTDSNKLCIELVDDGKGFDIKNTKFGNGINNIRKRAKAVNGLVEIISSINQGTRIKFEGRFNKLRISDV